LFLTKQKEQALMFRLFRNNDLISN